MNIYTWTGAINSKPLILRSRGSSTTSTTSCSFSFFSFFNVMASEHPLNETLAIERWERLYT